MANPAEVRSPAEAILAQAQGERVCIQDFCPLADSLEWQLGQRYWHERGSQAFLSDARPVPYLINNDGSLSHNAAEVLFASLVAAEQVGPLPASIFTLELGIGVGLFARFFLDAFQGLCLRHGKDYYARLCYVAGDRSEAMLRDAARHGVFARHPGRYLLRTVDALQPDSALLGDGALAREGPRPLRAVFLNYVLDCLPPAILEVDDHEVRRLCVRTCLARGTRLEDHTELSAAQLAHRAGSADPEHQRELLNVYGLFASEYAYQPVDEAQVPYGAFAVRYGRSTSRRFLHNYGALQALERLLGLLHDDGFILVTDYGPTEVTAGELYEHQRFSNATSIGLNFPLLKAYCLGGSGARWVEPPGENEHIHSRLLGHQPAAATIACFQERFSKAAFDDTRAPAHQARELAKTGRFEAAAASYRLALERQPRNWALLNEVALFLTYSLRHPKAGLDLAKVALDLNPLAAESWNTLGDGLYEFGRVAEARQAYLRAARLNSHDVRSRYSLAWIEAHMRDYPAALHQIAAALALDEMGVFRERLLQKQGDILARMAQQHQQEYLRMANRISGGAPPSEPGIMAVAPENKAGPGAQAGP